MCIRDSSGVLLVVVWLWVGKGQRPRRLTSAGGVVALIGLALVLNLTEARHVALIGVLWGLGAATGLAFYFVLCARTEEMCIRDSPAPDRRVGGTDQ